MHKSQEQKISSIQQLMDQLTKKLTSTIVALQSDQVIEQMRNDKSLYQYKLTHIKEIIEEHFNFQKQITHLISENQHLKQSLNLIELKIAKKDQEFREVIDMIEESAKQHTKNNENEINRLKGTIKQLQSKLINKSDVTEKISKKTNQLSYVINDLQNQKQRLKKEIGKLREENGKLIEINKKQKMNKKEVENENEKLIQNLKQEHQKEIQDYEMIVKKMQNDMLIIKTQWQKKCNQVEKNLRQFYEAEFLKLEEKKSRELIEHIQTMKEGKPVIIKQDQDILTTRIQSVRRQYDVQIERIQKHNREIQEMYQNLQSAHGAKVKQIEGLGDALKAVRNEFEDEKQNWMSQKQKSKREIEKLKAIVLEFERNNKDTVLSSQAKSSEILKLNDNIKFIQKKLEIANRTLNEQKNLIQTKDDQIQELKNKIVALEENYKKSKKNLDNLQNEIEGKNKKIQVLSRQADKLNEKVSDLSQKQEGLKVQIKNLKTSKTKYRKVVDKMVMQIKKSQKQLIQIREDVKYMQQSQRKKNLSDFDKFFDQIQSYKENIQKECKNRMNELICQIQQAKQAEHAQFQIVLRERQNLKREVSELEDLFQRKQRQVEEAKKNIVNAQTEDVKRTMLEEVQRERLKYQRLQQEIISNQREYHRRLEKVKGQVKDAVRVLTNKWMEQIIRVEEDNKRKDIELQRIMDKVQMVISDNEQSKDKYENEKEQAKRFRKKYEALKQQKDEQINDLIKRLQRQSKHKIALQKELRTIRSQLNKGEKYSKQHFDRQNKSGNNFQVTDREKQISEIRDLIARTYQVVGQKPEKDTKLDRKKALFD